KQLIYAVTGRTVGFGKLPHDVGVCVQNVHTALTLCYAVERGETSYRRVVTVSGDAATDPKNLWVRAGTLFSELAAYCGATEEGTAAAISGGPMMGIALPTLEFAAGKTTAALLLFSQEKAKAKPVTQCINCARCARVCPMHLMPMYIEQCTKAGDFAGAKRYGAEYCISCGCCTYVCPTRRPIVDLIPAAKKGIREKKL
ncbi:MAG: SLBB domain-containing protein, partial [Clostridiales bacterium]|nr:SLBB domain-containing protein [Clostridiales bacterium]